MEWISNLGQQTAAMFLHEGDNGNDIGFPRSDGRLPSLPEPIILYTKRDFRVSPSAVVQVFVSLGYKDGLPLISSAGVGVPSGLSSSVSFHSFRWAFALALQPCSFSSGSQTMTSGCPWQTNRLRETPRELTAPCHGAPHQFLSDQHAVDDFRVTSVTNRQRNSAPRRGDDAKISTLHAELFASTLVPNIYPLTRGKGL